MSQARIRVLHVVGSMGRAGTETWLMGVLRRADKVRFQFDFLVHSRTSGRTPGVYDDEIVKSGGRILYCQMSRNHLKYAIDFLRTLREYGPYDVIHCHLRFYTGFIIALSALAGVRVRIAHSHNSSDIDENTVWRRLYRAAMHGLLQRFPTTGLGCSQDACVSFFGANWQANPRFRVLYCGIDLESFVHVPPREVVRQQLLIPDHGFVVGHVGRLDAQKNHTFLLKVAAHMLRLQPDMWLLLVGDGALRGAVEQQAHDLGIGHRVVLAGVRADVPALMQAMDLFLFPSLFEGLPLALAEAQAAGLRCIISDAIPQEADIVPGLLTRLPLSAPPANWAQVAIEAAKAPAPDRTAAFNRVRDSFSIDHSAKALFKLYDTSCSQVHEAL